MTVQTNIEGVPASWTYWPEHEELSVELSRLLAAAQDGGSTIAECLLAASRIRIGDDNSWHREWRRIADINRERGDAAFDSGNDVTARSNWLRAVNYYQAAAFSLADGDGTQQAALSNMRECAAKYLHCRNPAAEIVTIPWLRDHPLEGYFLPAGLGSGRAPTVICLGEPGCRKETLFKLERHACDRGLSLLLVDLLGNGIDGLDKVIGRADPESAISRVMDYVSGRDDVDERRVAVLAHECSSSFAARGVASDSRFAAAVCDGGIWDLHERAFLASRPVAANADVVPDVQASRVARNIRIPLLVTLGEQGWLEAGRVTQIVDQLKTKHPDVTLRIFSSVETASQQGHADNSTLASEFIFDWIANRLAAEAAPSESIKAVAL